MWKPKHDVVDALYEILQNILYEATNIQAMHDTIHWTVS